MPRREVPVIVQAYLSDGDNPRVIRKRLQPGQDLGVKRLGIMGMHSHGRKDIGVRVGKADSGLARGEIASDRDDRRYAGVPCSP